MTPRSYGPIFISHISTASSSGFSNDNLDLHLGRFVCAKNQSFTNDTSVEVKCIEKVADFGYEVWWFETTGR